MRKRKSKSGRGLLNGIINKMPVELHIPGYQYCGPGTNLKKRLARGDPGINPLDMACKEHDIAYDKYPSGKERYEADKVLASRAWKRVTARDAKMGERSAALTVAGAMRAKMGLSKLGRGISKLKCKRKKKCLCTFRNLMKSAKNAIKKTKPENIDAAVRIAINAAKELKKGNKVAKPRIIPVPKIGGVLPLIPIFAGLSALGSIIGSTTGVVRAIGAANEAKKQLMENERHNKMMEAIAIESSSKGHGLYMKPYKKGLGLYIKPYPKNR